MPNQNTQADDEVRDEFARSFCAVASFQGRFAYCLMSIYAVNPHIFQYFTEYNPYSFLLSNMIYGITVMIICRPSLRPLVPIHRFTLSLLGSLAFNYSSLLWYDWLTYTFEGRQILLTFLGYVSGRVMIIHLMALLYHMDTRCIEPTSRPRRNGTFEAMYL